MRILVSSNFFNKKLGRFISKHPLHQTKIKKTLELLSKNAFDAKLKTHKLSGGLRMFYGASIDYEYRIVFSYDNENIFLINIGSHDEVY